MRQLPPGLAGHQRATAEVDCSQAKPRRPSAICYPSSSARRAKSRATVQQVKRIRACNVTWRLDPSRSTLTWLAVAPGPRTIPFLPLRRGPAARHLHGVSLADRKGARYFWTRKHRASYLRALHNVSAGLLSRVVCSELSGSLGRHLIREPRAIHPRAPACLGGRGLRFGKGSGNPYAFFYLQDNRWALRLRLRSA